MIEAPGGAAPAGPVPDAGTYTFLFTDIEDSTEMWDRHPSAMRAAMRMHDGVFDRQVKAHHGRLVELGREGDSVMCVFARASDAVTCALESQREMERTVWPAGISLRIRIAIHTGEAELRDAHFFGPALYRCSRLLAVANGGQTLVSGPSRDMVVDSLPASVSLLDLGFHRLRDLSRPEHIYQLAYPDLTITFPPLRSPVGRLTNLPAERTSFLGRETELAALKELIAGNRLVTVAGPGGMGKTRIAERLAADVVDKFPDGAWLVELDALTEPGLVAQEIANQLGVREVPGSDLLQRLAAHLESRRAFILLDNCEHLTAECARVADRLLAGCPSVTILATSREPLGLPGEHVWRLDPLSLARGPQDTAGSAPLSTAARLFIERAWPSRPVTQVDRKHLEVIEEICRRLDGIPLAIELAAARARLLSVDELVARLSDRLQILTGGPKSLPRHQTLRAAIDWSYQLLDDDERILLRRLSVFAGGFSAADVEDVCSGNGVERDGVLDLLGALVDKSLVMPMQIGSDDRPMRMLAAIQQYAHERLVEAGELDILEQRHAERFLRLAESLHGVEETRVNSDWLDRLEREHENLRAALAYSLRLSSELNLRLATALIGFWDARGYLTEGRDWLDRALATWPEETVWRGDALGAAGWLAQRQGDFARSEEHLALSVRVAEATGARAVQARSLRNLALVKLLRGDIAGAAPLVTGALSIAEDLDDRAGMAGALLVSALVAYFQGEREQARAYGEQSLEQHRNVGDEKVAAFVLACLATVALDDHDLARARANLVESLQISLRLHEKVDVAFVLETCARLAVATAEPARALRLAGAAAGIRRESSAAAAPLWSAMVDATLAPIRESLGADAAAAALRDGGSLGIDASVQEALGWLTDDAANPRSREGSPAEAGTAALTRREQEIAALVGLGLRNREIAKRLFLSTRTVDAHVEHIRTKLDFRSRAQIAAWAAAAGLVPVQK